MRYFYSELANRPLVGGNTNVIFEKTCIIGSNICGIYATDNRDELALLDGAIAQRGGVIEIKFDEYAQQQAQKKNNSQLSAIFDLEARTTASTPTAVSDQSGQGGCPVCGKSRGAKVV